MYQNMIVTGGAGFVGSNLVKELQLQYPDSTLTVIDDFRSGHFKNLEGFTGDIIAEDVAEMDLEYYFGDSEVDVVFHLASITDTTNHNQRQQVYDNVEAWRNLLNFFVDSNTRFVYASSAATYGITDGINRVDQPARPANVYAFSKVQMDNLARRWAEENPAQTVVGLRYFNVYGPHENHKGAAGSMILQLAQQMLSGKNPRIFKHGEQHRDFVYVKDIVEATLLAAKADVSGIYNAGSGRPRSFNDVVENLNRVLRLNCHPEYIDNPHAHYQPHTEADLIETTEALGYIPKYSLEAGIDDYLDSGWLK